MITIGFGIIVIVIDFIITGTGGGIWFIVRGRKERTKASSGVGIERVINNIEQED